MVSLRARKSRPSYANLYALPSDEEGEQVVEEGNPEAGPSTKRRKVTPVEDPIGSGSDFDPEEEAVSGEGEGDANIPLDDVSEEEDLQPEEIDDESPEPAQLGTVVKTHSKPRGGKGKAMIPSAGNTQNTIQTLHTTYRRTNPASSNLSNNAARLRPKPVYISGNMVMRLTERPSPFRPAKMQITNPTIGDVAHKIHKTWLNSVMSGPIWELIEDLGWFKELLADEDGVMIRPTVHTNLAISPSDITVLGSEYVMYILL